MTLIDILQKALEHRKMVPMHILTTQFDANGLADVQNQCEAFIHYLDAHITTQTEEELKMSKFQAFFSKAFLESQLVVIIRAKKSLVGCYESQHTTIENDIIKFDINVN